MINKWQCHMQKLNNKYCQNIEILPTPLKVKCIKVYLSIFLFYATALYKHETKTLVTKYTGTCTFMFNCAHTINAK